MSQVERDDIAVGRLYRRLPEQLRALHSMVLAAMVEFDPQTCGQCGGPLDELRTACAEADAGTGRLIVMLLHPGCSAAHDPEWIERGSVPLPH